MVLLLLDVRLRPMWFLPSRPFFFSICMHGCSGCWILVSVYFSTFVLCFFFFSLLLLKIEEKERGKGEKEGGRKKEEIERNTNRGPSFFPVSPIPVYPYSRKRKSCVLLLRVKNFCASKLKRSSTRSRRILRFPVL